MFSRETEPIRHVCVYVYIYGKELAHTIMEAESRPGKLVLQYNTRPKAGKTGFSGKRQAERNNPFSLNLLFYGYLQQIGKGPPTLVLV